MGPVVIDQASVSRRRAAVYCVVELSVALRAQQGWLTCCFTSTETVGLLGAGAQDVHFDFHTAPSSAETVVDDDDDDDDDEVMLNVLRCQLTY